MKLENAKRDFERVAAKELEALTSDKEKEARAEREAIMRVSETQVEALVNDDVGILGESMADALGYELNEEGNEIVHVDRDAEIGGAEEVSTLRENQ